MQQQHAAAASDAGMQQERRNRAQLVSTGMYTFYREELALTVGTQEDPAKYGYNITAGLGDQFLQNCLDACDELGRCAGVCADEVCNGSSVMCLVYECSTCWLALPQVSQNTCPFSVVAKLVAMKTVTFNKGAGGARCRDWLVTGADATL
jgi:hypothetical protein